MTALITQPSFAAGEIGPELYGRVDQALYYIGLRTCRNFIVRQYGGAANRPGYRYISEGKDQTEKVKLIPFNFNEQQTYCLEFGDLYMRVIKDGGEVLETSTASTITAITKADPVVVTAANSFSNGDDVFLTGILGMVELNGRVLRVANVTGANFELTDMFGTNIDSTGYSTYASAGTATTVFTLTTPFAAADLFELNYAQSNDVLTIVHPDYYPRDITRTDHDAWTLAEFSNSGGPFKDINAGAITVYSSATTGSVTITASAALFDAGMVGELFYIQQTADDTTERWEAAKAITANDIRRAGANYYKANTTATTGTYRPDWIEGSSTDGDGAVEWDYLHSGFGIVEITAFGSTTSVTATVINTLPDLVIGAGNTTINWALSAWSAAEGYPSAVTYHKSRMIYGGTTQQPNGIWMSSSGLRSVFLQSNPILDDDAIDIFLNTNGANSVRHLISFAELIALTSASEHMINGSDNVLLATGNVFNRVQGYTGASKVPPLIIDNTALFVQDMGAVVRSLQYQLDTDTFGGIDLTARSPHLFKSKTIVDWSFQRHPLSVIWVIMSDGELNGFTFMDEQKVFAWHRHDSAASAEFESVCCIREGDETAAYFSVKRTIDGVTRRYTERAASRTFSDVKDAYFLDSGQSYDGRNTTAVTMTITGGTTWDSPEELTVTSSTAQFLATDIGNQVTFWVDDIAYRLNITAFTNTSVVTAVPTKALPVAFQGVAFTDWELARDKFQPLWNIEGETVSALVDGNVMTGLTVTNGAVTLAHPGAVVHVGLPYVADLETLDLAKAQNAGDVKAEIFNIPRVFLTVQESRAVFVSTTGLNTDDTLTDTNGNLIFEVKQREPIDGYDAPIPAETEVFEVITSSTWSRKGRVAIRQPFPLPITINGITPEVALGTK